MTKEELIQNLKEIYTLIYEKRNTKARQDLSDIIRYLKDNNLMHELIPTTEERPDESLHYKLNE